MGDQTPCCELVRGQGWFQDDDWPNETGDGAATSPVADGGLQDRQSLCSVSLARLDCRPPRSKGCRRNLVTAAWGLPRAAEMTLGKTRKRREKREMRGCEGGVPMAVVLCNEGPYRTSLPLDGCTLY